MRMWTPRAAGALATAHGDAGPVHATRAAYTASMSTTFMISAIAVAAAALLAALLMRNTSPEAAPDPAEEPELVA
jgi:hypothetical protein